MLALALPATPRVASPPAAVVGVSVAKVLDQLRGRLAGRRVASGRPGRPVPCGPATHRSAPPPRRRQTSPICSTHGSLLGEHVVLGDGCRAGRRRPAADRWTPHRTSPPAPRRPGSRPSPEAASSRPGGRGASAWPGRRRRAARRRRSPSTAQARVVLIGRSRSVISSSCVRSPAASRSRSRRRRMRMPTSERIAGVRVTAIRMATRTATAADGAHQAEEADAGDVERQQRDDDGHAGEDDRVARGAVGQPDGLVQRRRPASAGDGAG